MLSALHVHERTSMYIVQYCSPKPRGTHYTWYHMVHMVPHGTHGTTWYHMVPHGTTWYTWYTWYHMVHLFLTFVSYGMNTNLVTQADYTASLQQFRVLV